MTELDLATARAAEARLRLNATVETLQARLAPRMIARDAIEGLTATGEKAIDIGTETAKRHPGKIIVLASLLAALLARRQIGAAIRRALPAKPAASKRVPAIKGAPAPTERTSA